MTRRHFAFQTLPLWHPDEALPIRCGFLSRSPCADRASGSQTGGGQVTWSKRMCTPKNTASHPAWPQPSDCGVRADLTATKLALERRGCHSTRLGVTVLSPKFQKQAYSTPPPPRRSLHVPYCSLRLSGVFIFNWFIFVCLFVYNSSRENW